jgi:hypothetical protein
VLFTAVALLAIRNSLLPRRTAGLILAAVLASSAVRLAMWFITETGKGIANIWVGLVLLFAVAAVMRRMLAIRTVTLQNIYGAISAYLIIGVAFASFFASIGHPSRRPLLRQGQPGSTQAFQYFSFTTLATIGYGDFTAAGSFGRAIADLEALGARYSWSPWWPSWSPGSGLPASRNADQPAPESYPAGSYAPCCGACVPGGNANPAAALEDAKSGGQAHDRPAAPVIAAFGAHKQGMRGRRRVRSGATLAVQGRRARYAPERARCSVSAGMVSAVRLGRSR